MSSCHLLGTGYFENNLHSQHFISLSKCLHANYLTPDPNKPLEMGNVFIIPISQIKKARRQGRQGFVAGLAGTLVRIKTGVNSLTLGWGLLSVRYVKLLEGSPGEYLRVAVMFK